MIAQGKFGIAILFFFATLFCATGCAVRHDVPRAKTISQSIAYAEAATASLANTIGSEFSAGKISITNARELEVVLRSAAEALDFASNAIRRGDSQTAQTKLNVAQYLLGEVRNQLLEKSQ